MPQQNLLDITQVPAPAPSDKMQQALGGSMATLTPYEQVVRTVGLGEQAQQARDQQQMDPRYNPAILETPGATPQYMDQVDMVPPPAIPKMNLPQIGASIDQSTRSQNRGEIPQFQQAVPSTKIGAHDAVPESVPQVEKPVVQQKPVDLETAEAAVKNNMPELAVQGSDGQIESIESKKDTSISSTPQKESFYLDVKKKLDEQESKSRYETGAGLTTVGLAKYLLSDYSDEDRKYIEDRLLADPTTPVSVINELRPKYDSTVLGGIKSNIAGGEQILSGMGESGRANLEIEKAQGNLIYGKDLPIQIDTAGVNNMIQKGLEEISKSDQVLRPQLAKNLVLEVKNKILGDVDNDIARNMMIKHMIDITYEDLYEYTKFVNETQQELEQKQKAITKIEEDKKDSYYTPQFRDYNKVLRANLNKGQDDSKAFTIDSDKEYAKNPYSNPLKFQDFNEVYIANDSEILDKVYEADKTAFTDGFKNATEWGKHHGLREEKMANEFSEKSEVVRQRLKHMNNIAKEVYMEKAKAEKEGTPYDYEAKILEKAQKIDPTAQSMDDFMFGGEVKAGSTRKSELGDMASNLEMAIASKSAPILFAGKLISDGVLGTFASASERLGRKTIFEDSGNAALALTPVGRGIGLTRKLMGKSYFMEGSTETMSSSDLEKYRYLISDERSIGNVIQSIGPELLPLLVDLFFGSHGISSAKAAISGVKGANRLTGLGRSREGAKAALIMSYGGAPIRIKDPTINMSKAYRLPFSQATVGEKVAMLASRALIPLGFMTTQGIEGLNFGAKINTNIMNQPYRSVDMLYDGIFSFMDLPVATMKRIYNLRNVSSDLLPAMGKNLGEFTVDGLKDINNIVSMFKRGLKEQQAAMKMTDKQIDDVGKVGRLRKSIFGAVVDTAKKNGDGNIDAALNDVLDTMNNVRLGKNVDMNKINQIRNLAKYVGNDKYSLAQMIAGYIPTGIDKASGKVVYGVQDVVAPGSFYSRGRSEVDLIGKEATDGMIAPDELTKIGVDKKFVHDKFSQKEVDKIVQKAESLSKDNPDNAYYKNVQDMFVKQEDGSYKMDLDKAGIVDNRQPAQKFRDYTSREIYNKEGKIVGGARKSIDSLYRKMKENGVLPEFQAGQTLETIFESISNKIC